MISWPIFVVDGEEFLKVFSSDIHSRIEPEDVRDGCNLAYDSAGQVLQLTVETNDKDLIYLPRFLRWMLRSTKVNVVETGIIDKENLLYILNNKEETQYD